MQDRKKKTYQTPETEIFLFGDDIIRTSGPVDDHLGDLLPDNAFFTDSDILN